MKTQSRSSRYREKNPLGKSIYKFFANFFVRILGGSLVKASVVIFLLSAIVRLGYVCLNKEVDGINLVEFANNRNTVTKTLYANRGSIYDSNGDVLAQNVNSYTLIAYLSPKRTKNPDKPNHVVDKIGTATALSPIINMPVEDILSRLDKDLYQVEFGLHGKLNESQKEQIEALNLPGLDYINTLTRYYRMSTFSSYIVGYAKKDENNVINGELGAEKYYNKELSGVDGYVTYQKDAYGYKMNNMPSIEQPAVDGDDIYLTIDSNIQLIAENAMRELTAKTDNKLDWALFSVVDAKTGAIVASATAPSFNPNDLSTITSYTNPLVSYTYEPGSTMKTFSWASAIDSGNYDGNKKYKSGSIKLSDGTVIRDSRREGWGTISLDTGFAYSSNVGATMNALAMGRSTLKSYYEKLGFGAKTGIELAGEVKGDISFRYESELATASFGQGVTVTPIEMLQAYTTIANDGVMLKPYIVDKIVDKDGNEVYKGGRKELGRVFEKTTTDHMQELMYNMVYNGTMKIWRPSNVTLMAKTGTAQIAGKGGYLTGEYDVIRSLAGIFPKDNPRYIIYALGQKMHIDITDWAKIVVKMIEEITAYSKLTEESLVHDKVHSYIKMDNFVNMKTKDVVGKLKETNVNYYVFGDGDYVINQYPSKNSKVFKERTNVFILTNSQNYVMPDLRGLSSGDVKTIFSLLDIKYHLTGSGVVVSQSVEPGEPIPLDEQINLELGEEYIPTIEEIVETEVKEEKEKE